MQQDFIKRSEIERVALKSIIQIAFDGKEYEYYLTPVDGYDIYDGYCMFFDPLTKSIIHRVLFEVKVRDRHYPNLLLEEKKWKDLKKKADESGASVVYVNVTPNGSYLFNLTKLIGADIEWVEEDHWVSTTDKSRGKITKWVTYLPVEKAKSYYYTTSRAELEWGKNNKTKEMDVEMISHRKRFCLFDSVLNKKDD